MEMLFFIHVLVTEDLKKNQTIDVELFLNCFKYKKIFLLHSSVYNEYKILRNTADTHL